MNQIACLLLAAGNASRFGGKKQLALIDGQPMILHTLNQLTSVFHDDVYIVTGAYADDVRPYVEDRAHVIENDEWLSGMGTSIAKGVERYVIERLMLVLWSRWVIRLSSVAMIISDCVTGLME